MQVRLTCAKPSPNGRISKNYGWIARAKQKSVWRGGGCTARENFDAWGQQVNARSEVQRCVHAGTIVVDNLTELNRIAKSFLRSAFQRSPASRSKKFPNIWLRLQPGLAVETHHTHTQTGQSDSKFGMTPDEIIEAAQICKSSKLPLTGMHFHQGSNFRNSSPLVSAIGMALDLVKEIGFDKSWHFCPGGGWGTAYHEDELPQPDIEEYVRVIAEKVHGKMQSRQSVIANFAS